MSETKWYASILTEFRGEEERPIQVGITTHGSDTPRVVLKIDDIVASVFVDPPAARAFGAALIAAARQAEATSTEEQAKRFMDLMREHAANTRKLETS